MVWLMTLAQHLDGSPSESTWTVAHAHSWSSHGVWRGMLGGRWRESWHAACLMTPGEFVGCRPRLKNGHVRAAMKKDASCGAAHGLRPGEAFPTHGNNRFTTQWQRMVALGVSVFAAGTAPGNGESGGSTSITLCTSVLASAPSRGYRVQEICWQWLDGGSHSLL